MRDQAEEDDRRPRAADARYVLRQLRYKLRMGSDRRTLCATPPAQLRLKVTSGDVRLLQEVFGHPNLNTLARYTSLVDACKDEANGRNPGHDRVRAGLEQDPRSCRSGRLASIPLPSLSVWSR